MKTLKRDWVELAESALLMGMSAAFLWHFSNILRLGSHFIQEPHMPILLFEISFLLGVFGFGCWRYVRLVRKP